MISQNFAEFFLDTEIEKKVIKIQFFTGLIDSFGTNYNKNDSNLPS